MRNCLCSVDLSFLQQEFFCFWFGLDKACKTNLASNKKKLLNFWNAKRNNSALLTIYKILKDLEKPILT